MLLEGKLFRNAREYWDRYLDLVFSM